MPEGTQVLLEGKSLSHSWLTEPLRGQYHLLKSLEVKIEGVARPSSVTQLHCFPNVSCVLTTPIDWDRNALHTWPVVVGRVFATKVSYLL